MPPVYPGRECDYEHIRTWEEDSFRLELWDTFKLHRGGPQSRLAYQFFDRGELIFQGDDFGCSTLRTIDSNACVASLLGFLSLRPGDTDREYFDDYTPQQMVWCQECGRIVDPCLRTGGNRTVNEYVDYECYCKYGNRWSYKGTVNARTMRLAAYRMQYVYDRNVWRIRPAGSRDKFYLYRLHSSPML